jgi:hypothetical protein
MRHSSIVVLDNSIRNCWYGQGEFGLSAGLQASANMKKKRDSSDKVKWQAGVVSKMSIPSSLF